MILLLDPLPTLTEGIERDVIDAQAIVAPEKEGLPSGNGIRNLPVDVEAVDGELPIKERHLNQPQVTGLQRIMQSITRYRTGKVPGETVEVHRTDFEKLRPLPIFEQAAPRAQVDIGIEEAFHNEDLMELLKSQLYDTKSTKAEYLGRILVIRDFSALVLLQPLLEIINRDVLNLLKLLKTSLDQINLDILDDNTMEESLPLWRGLITRAQLELPDLQRSLTSFIKFMPNIRVPSEIPSRSISVSNGVEKAPNHEIVPTTKDLMDQIEKKLPRLETASSSITQTWPYWTAVVPSPKQKELPNLPNSRSSFFIPLTFAATLFGMEIEQLQTPAPLSLFVAIGIAFVSASYIMRLMIRSSWIRDLRQACTASIKVYADRNHITVQRGNMTLTLFLGWIVFETSAAMKSSWYLIKIGTRAPFA